MTRISALAAILLGTFFVLEGNSQLLPSRVIDPPQLYSHNQPLQIQPQTQPTQSMLISDALVVVSPKWHASVVKPYLDALSHSESATFDETSARRETSRLYADHSLPIRGEFEAKDVFQKRVDAVIEHNKTASQQREKALDDAKKKHAKALIESRKIASELSRRRDETLYVMFPSVAPRYDIDTKKFDALPLPKSRLGLADYGLVDMDLQIKTKAFGCPDIEMAKKIRTVSDEGNLWSQ